jgi:hypothetical protein
MSQVGNALGMFLSVCFPEVKKTWKKSKIRPGLDKKEYKKKD